MKLSLTSSALIASAGEVLFLFSGEGVGVWRGTVLSLHWAQMLNGLSHFPIILTFFFFFKVQMCSSVPGG